MLISQTRDRALGAEAGIAAVFGKEHQHVLRDIDAILHAPNLGDGRPGWFRQVATEHPTVAGREHLHEQLHIERAIAAANAGPADFQVMPSRLTDLRTLLVANTHFVLERIDLAPNSAWCLEAERETWLLVLSGGARAGSFDVAKGDAIFAQSDRVDIHPGPIGMVGLAAYTGGDPVPHLLRRVEQPGTMDAGRPQDGQVPTSLTQAKAAATNGRLETTQ